MVSIVVGGHTGGEGYSIDKMDPRAIELHIMLSESQALFIHSLFYDKEKEIECSGQGDNYHLKGKKLKMKKKNCMELYLGQFHKSLELIGNKWVGFCRCTYELKDPNRKNRKGDLDPVVSFDHKVKIEIDINKVPDSMVYGRVNFNTADEYYESTGIRILPETIVKFKK